MFSLVVLFCCMVYVSALHFRQLISPRLVVTRLSGSLSTPPPSPSSMPFNMTHYRGEALQFLPANVDEHIVERVAFGFFFRDALKDIENEKDKEIAFARSEFALEIQRLVTIMNQTEAQRMKELSAMSQR